MFNPNLDLTDRWQLVTSFASPSGRFNQEHTSSLNIRADAIRIKVTIENSINSWKVAGNLIQLWQPQNEQYQLSYHKVYLNNQTVVPIEPLSISLLKFTPVAWLYDWEITIHAREYTPQKQLVFEQQQQVRNTIPDRLNIDLGFL